MADDLNARVAQTLVAAYKSGHRAPVDADARALSREEAERIRRKAEAAAAKREAEATRSREGERQRCLAIWRGSKPAAGSPVEDYLRARHSRHR